jgi:predicted deacylase
VLEPFHENGTAVREGQPAGRIHHLTDPGREPEILTYRADGMLYGRRQPGRVRPGNCCLVVAAPFAGSLAPA